MNDPFENKINPAEAVETLKTFQDEEVDPRVVEFAHFLADKIGDRDIVPGGFVMCTLLSLYDLEHGKDGFSGEPINSPLVGINKQERDELLRHVPYLARVAFPQGFADEVHKDMATNNILPAPEASDKPTLDSSEIIPETIDNIDDAYERIIVDARDRVLALDWQHFGVDVEKQSNALETAYIPLTLRNAPYPLGINLLVDEPGKEAGLLRELLPEQKRQLFDNYWIALTAFPLSAEAAMKARDHVFLKGIELMATVLKVPVEDVLPYFARDVDGPVVRASVRLANSIANN